MSSQIRLRRLRARWRSVYPFYKSRFSPALRRARNFASELALFSGYLADTGLAARTWLLASCCRFCRQLFFTERFRFEFSARDIPTTIAFLFRRGYSSGAPRKRSEIACAKANRASESANRWKQSRRTNAKLLRSNEVAEEIAERKSAESFGTAKRF